MKKIFQMKEPSQKEAGAQDGKALHLSLIHIFTCPIQGLIVGALSGLSAAAGVMVGKRLGRKEYDEAYTESKKIMYAGLAGAVAVSALLILLAGVYTGLYRVDGSVKELGRYC